MNSWCFFFMDLNDYQDGFVRFWNPKSGEEIMSMMTDDTVENNEEENMKVTE